MKENKVENLIWIIFAIVGAIFVIIGLVLCGSKFNYKNKDMMKITKYLFHILLMEKNMSQE